WLLLCGKFCSARHGLTLGHKRRVGLLRFTQSLIQPIGLRMPSRRFLRIVGVQGGSLGSNLGEDGFAGVAITINRFVTQTKSQAWPVVLDRVRNFVENHVPVSLPQRGILFGIHPEQDQAALQFVESTNRVLRTKYRPDVV